jgi:hypothetical protein
MSKASLPLSTHGYFSDPGNFDYFAECADSWLKIPPKSKLGPVIERTLRLVFESASQLGLFEGAGKRLTWKQKLWTIGAHWGIDQEPWLFDEFGDAPMALDLYQVSNRLEQEVEALQAAKSAASSLGRVCSAHGRASSLPVPGLSSSPCPSPYPAENLSDINQELEQQALRREQETSRERAELAEKLEFERRETLTLVAAEHEKVVQLLLPQAPGTKLAQEAQNKPLLQQAQDSFFKDADDPFVQDELKETAVEFLRLKAKFEQEIRLKEEELVVERNRTLEQAELVRKLRGLLYGLREVLHDQNARAQTLLQRQAIEAKQAQEAQEKILLQQAHEEKTGLLRQWKSSQAELCASVEIQS